MLVLCAKTVSIQIDERQMFAVSRNFAKRAHESVRASDVT